MNHKDVAVGHGRKPHPRLTGGVAGRGRGQQGTFPGPAALPDIPHGRYGTYTDYGCRCPECREAARRYNKRRNVAIARGQWGGRQDPARVLAHIALLRSLGCPVTYIEDECGIPRSSLDRIRRQRWVNAATAERILAIEPLNPTVLAWRRIEGLLALGYTKRWIAEQLGSKRFDYSRQRMRLETVRRIASVAEQVGDTPGPSNRARAYARRRGYLTPAAWDDWRDPQPVELDDAPLLEEDLDRQTRVALLTERGASAMEIARVLGINPRTVHRDRVRVAS